jgi:hypothetical protein
MSEKTLNLLCSNVRGIVCHWEIISSTNWSSYDILAFNEVWQIKEYENLTLEGFELKACKLRNNTRGGGTLIYVKQGLIVSQLETPFIEGTIESTGIKIGEINFVNIYRPPSGDKDIFIDSLMQFLDTLRGSKIILGGDFNINFRERNRWISSITDNFNLAVKITNITRPESETCIDSFITNLEGSFGVTEIMIADHLAIKAVLKLSDKKQKKKFESRMYREMKEANWLLFNHRLYNAEITGSTIEVKWENLLVSVKNIVEECFPLKESKNKYIFKMSPGLLKCRDKKNKLLKQYKQGRLDKQIYIRYNSIYRKLIKQEQVKRLSSELAEAGSNGKKKWNALKKSLLITQNKNQIEAIEQNNNLITEKAEIARAFKHHFETCATSLAEGLPEGRDTSVIMEQGPAWSFKNTTIAELVKITKSLKNKNSSGPDSLSNKMLKKEPYLFARLLHPLINESIQKGIFPKDLKKANVIPIFKKGSQ